MKVNLTLLITNRDTDISTVPDLPTEDDMQNAFNLNEQADMDTNPEDTQSNCESGDLEVNELCIVIWDDDKLSKRSWYVGICRDRQDESYEIEHMTRVKEKGQNAHER